MRLSFARRQKGAGQSTESRNMHTADIRSYLYENRFLYDRVASGSGGAIFRLPTSSLVLQVGIVKAEVRTLNVCKYCRGARKIPGAALGGAKVPAYFPGAIAVAMADLYII